MTYRAHIKGGVVVLENPSALEEGTEVEILPLPQAVDLPGQALEKLAGKAEGLPADLSQRHDHYRRVAKP